MIIINILLLLLNLALAASLLHTAIRVGRDRHRGVVAERHMWRQMLHEALCGPESGCQHCRSFLRDFSVRCQQIGLDKPAKCYRCDFEWGCVKPEAALVCGEK